MNSIKCQNISECQQNHEKTSKILQKVIIGIILIPFCLAFGEDLHHINNSRLRIEYLNPYAKILTRGPNNFVPDDDVVALPMEVSLWTQNILVEDTAGVLVRIKSDVKSWEHNESYAKRWNLESTGLYLTPNHKSRKAYLKSHMLKYLDKRLSGEIRNAKKGSALQRIGQAQKALTPKAEASISENIKVKLNAKVIEGTTTLIVENPYIDYQTRVDTHGRVEIKFGKKIKEAKISSEIRYEVAADRWVAQLDRPISSRLRARLSSTQNDSTMAFTKKSDNKIELMYYNSF